MHIRYRMFGTVIVLVALVVCILAGCSTRSSTGGGVARPQKTNSPRSNDVVVQADTEDAGAVRPGKVPIHTGKLGRVLLLKPKPGGYADLFERDLDTDSTELLISYRWFPKTFVWPVEAVKPSPDGEYLALIESVNVFSGGGRCWVWERKTGRVSKVSDDSLGSAGFDWLPEGKRLLVHDDAGGLYFDGPYDGSIAFYDAATHKLSKLGPVKGLVLAVPASKSSNVIEVLSIKGDRSSVYMQPSVGERKFLFQWPGLIFSIIQSPDSSRFVFYDFDNYYVTDTRGRNARKFKIPAVNENLLTTFKFNNSGTRVGVFTEYCAGEPHVNKTQQLWVADVRSGHAWRIAKWEELFQGRDLAIARTLEGWLPDASSIVISGDLYYGIEKPADTEHDWCKLWSYNTDRKNTKSIQLFDSGKGWYGAAWWYIGPTL